MSVTDSKAYGVTLRRAEFAPGYGVEVSADGQFATLVTPKFRSRPIPIALFDPARPIDFLDPVSPGMVDG